MAKANEVTTIPTQPTRPMVQRDASGAPSETTAIIQMIERVALNPSVDIDKMERLMQMQERILSKSAEAAFTEAFATMQPELPVIVERGGIKNGRGEIQSTYALWEDINEAIKPVLAKHGFALSFRTGQRDGKIIVTGILRHSAGHSDETTIELMHDSSGSKNAVQAVGSSTSYGKRYTAAALLNLTSRGEDDDGKAADGVLSEKQVADLQSLIVEVAADIPRFCKFMKVDRIENIPAKQYDRALTALQAKRAKQ